MSFTIHGHGDHLVQWCGTILTNGQYPFDRRHHVKSGENSGQDYMILHMYIACLRADNSSDKILTVTKKFYYFNHSL